MVSISPPLQACHSKSNQCVSLDVSFSFVQCVSEITGQASSGIKSVCHWSVFQWHYISVLTCNQNVSAQSVISSTIDCYWILTFGWTDGHYFYVCIFQAHLLCFERVVDSVNM